jgi:DNA-binding NarL/FixJ family response regulator
MSQTGQLRIVILKWDRLYGDLIRRHIWDVWPNAVICAFQHGIDALNEIQEQTPHLFVTGVSVEDMDGLEHLEPFIDKPVPILIVTSRPNTRMFEMLRQVRYDGIFDGSSEGMDHLPAALRRVLQGGHYVSPSLVPFLKGRKSVTLEALTEREQIVLSVIGDGSDNKEASKRLGISQYTAMTHRNAIMRKLGLHHSKELMQYALVHGYVVITAKGIYRPGFQRRIGLPADRRMAGRKPASRVPVEAEEAMEADATEFDS